MNKEINISRAYFYEFFAQPFLFKQEQNFALWHKQAQILASNMLDEGLDEDFKVLLGFDYDHFKAEQNAMFYDLSYVNVPLSASFYDEGRDDGRMKLQACELIRKSKFRKDEQCRQSEDEFGFLFAFIASIVSDEANIAEQLFRFVLNPVIDEFIEKLSIHQNSHFYAHLARIMAVFFAHERAYLNVQAPMKKEGKSLADKALERLPYEPKLPTKFSKINTEELTKL